MSKHEPKGYGRAAETGGGPPMSAIRRAASGKVDAGTGKKLKGANTGKKKGR